MVRTGRRVQVGRRIGVDGGPAIVGVPGHFGSGWLRHDGS